MSDKKCTAEKKAEMEDVITQVSHEKKKPKNAAYVYVSG